ncbi:PREDICTED: protection of telomeres protein 1-like, partial [Priapulus caudatus]|uniref:Protection of telomeres protein 1-like n=1 Tax=Priapulus caudatus TaxID=37621 RepID=A0ABM1F769_PRICU
MTICTAHRLQRRATDNPATIIGVFLYWSDREAFLKARPNLRGSKMSVRTDLPPELEMKRGALAHTAYEIRRDEKIQTRLRENGVDIWGMTYSYTNISDVKEGTIVNVWGVVKYYKPPQRSRGSDVHMMLSLVDPSCIDAGKLKCSLFCQNEEALPKVTEVGQIVRMHRVKTPCVSLQISMFNHNVQAQTGVGFACLVFTSGVDTPVVPETGSQTYTLGDADKEKVKQLRRWYADVRNKVND